MGCAAPPKELGDTAVVAVVAGCPVAVVGVGCIGCAFIFVFCIGCAVPPTELGITPVVAVVAGGPVAVVGIVKGDFTFVS